MSALRAELDSYLLTYMVDPAQCPLPEAIALGKRMSAVYPQFDAELMRMAADEKNPGRALYLLEILGAVSNGKRILPRLMTLLHAGDPRVRSKAAKLVGVYRPDADWMAAWFDDLDPRMRANVVESLWEADPKQTVKLFRLAASDPHHRVAANGVVGLHHAGALESPEKIIALASHPDEHHRAASAWVMGETGEERYLDALKKLARDPSQLVRMRTVRSLVKLNKALKG